MRPPNSRWLLIPLVLAALSRVVAGDPEVAEHDGRVEVRRNGAVVMAWQREPLPGGKPAGSAFLQNLRTPSGFEVTSIQPADHPHHFGIWWPWKFVEVDGKQFNTWEIQQGQGRHVARKVRRLPSDAGTAAWEFVNETEILEPGQPPQVIIRENARVAFHVSGADAHVIDISIAQTPVAHPVTISAYRYSGFAWRGPASWNATNGRLITSEGAERENANGRPARWVVVSGPTPTGTASVLILSAAAKIAGTPERLRVWDSKNQNGTPFVNFNPVQDKPLLLDASNPAVSNRKYRVVVADRAITPEEAESEWKSWFASDQRPNPK